MLVSPVRKAVARTVLLRADQPDADRTLAAVFAELESAALADMRAEGIAAEDVSVARLVDARYAGQSHELRVTADNWCDALHQAHETRYGFANRNNVAEAVTLRVEASAAAPPMPLFDSTDGAAPTGRERVYFDGSWTEVAVVPRAGIESPIAGPAVITEYSATTWIPAGWRIEPLAGGALLLGRM
jgi:N-methylhydantoinase A